MKKKIDKNMALFFLKMVVLFVVISQILVDTILVNGALTGIFTAKYGLDFLVEGLRALFILVVLLLFGNSYIFKEKGVKWKEAVSMGWPMLIISSVYLVQNINFLKNHTVDPNAIINCLAFCITIGIFEEFLCRGWLQNEFIERFKKDKNQVIKSIVLSSLVFGIMHITNIWSTNQGIFITILQILQALSVGILLGAIYYKTKNIWSVVFLHAFYDLSLMIGESYFIRDPETGVYSKEMIIYQVVTTILICTMYILSTILVLRSETGRKLTTPKKDQERALTVAILVIMAFVLAPIHIPGGEKTTKYFTYEEKEIKDYYEIVEIERRQSYYELEGNNTKLILSEDVDYPGKVFIRCNGNVIRLKYNVDTLLVLENKTNYKVVILEDGIRSTTAHYIKIEKSRMNSSEDYLEKLSKSFKHYDLPEIVSVGYIGYSDGKDAVYKEVYLGGQYNNRFIIDDENKLFFMTKE